MTQLPPVVPTQEDREAAAGIGANGISRQHFESGEVDWHPLVQAFARHRLASYDSHYLAQEVEAPASKGGEVDALRSLLKDYQDFAGATAGACLGLAMSGSNHPAPDEPLMEIFRNSQALAAKARDTLARAALLTPTESAGERRYRTDLPDPNDPRYQAARTRMANILFTIGREEPASGFGRMADELMCGDLMQVPTWIALGMLAASPTTPSASGAGASRSSDNFDAAMRYQDGERETIAIPAGMKPWSGGYGPPRDHDYGPVQRRDGRIIPSPVTGNQWVHVASDADADIVAYTPRAEQTGDGI